MNAGDLPLGHAPFRLMFFNADGSSGGCGVFVKREVAERTAAWLNQLFPENQYLVVEETPVLPGLKGKV